MDLVIKRFDVYLVDLNPTIGSEINKVRPCLVVSSDDINKVLNTVIVAPLTSTIRKYPTRINCLVAGKNGQIALDQIRTIDKRRLNRKIDVLDLETGKQVLKIIVEMFLE